MAVTPAGAVAPVAPGQYWTAINIHNPSKCEAANFRWKVTLGNPGAPGPISAYRTARPLDPDRGIELDCRQIMNALTPAPAFAKGYVVIESDIELDVVAVYSTAQSPTGSVNSFHTERVEARCVPVCEDLILPLNTGIADWRTVGAPSGTLGTVVPVSPNAAWGAPPFGSLWVSQAAADSQSAALGTYLYDLCFDLCFGFTVPARFNIQAMADDVGRVFLNGNLIGNTTGFATPVTLSVNTQFLRPGRNCFRVSVNNVASATGFALAGLLRIAGGKCPCSALPLLPPPPSGGGLPTVIGEIAADESEEPSGGKKASRKRAKKSQSRKRGSKKKAGR
ncbi:MAG TPA: hypothetical protein VJ842_17945 [Pyrinomonadaceae bacterium]|nr:hypothetical protein [Pyrinomonadaceae bacterium]